MWYVVHSLAVARRAAVRNVARAARWIYREYLYPAFVFCCYHGRPPPPQQEPQEEPGPEEGPPQEEPGPQEGPQGPPQDDDFVVLDVAVEGGPIT
jgi:hypothetical protein